MPLQICPDLCEVKPHKCFVEGRQLGAAVSKLIIKEVLRKIHLCCVNEGDAFIYDCLVCCEVVFPLIVPTIPLYVSMLSSYPRSVT